jgi:hypothetical protein
MSSPIAIYARACSLFAFAFYAYGIGNLYAQAIDYLKPIGGSDVELFFQLDVLPAQGELRHDGEKIKLVTEEVDATYTLSRGKVTHVSYIEDFRKQDAADEAFRKVRQFMESSGIRMKDVGGTTGHRVTSGEGNGMHGSLLLIPAAGGGFRLNAEIFAQRE